MRRVKIAILFVAGCVLLTACAEPQLQKICRESGEIRPCTPRELVMIDDMHTIIRAVRNYELIDPKEIAWAGHASKRNANPKVLFYGESHPEIIGRIQTLGAINQDLKKGDILLLEGSDWREDLIADCGVQLIYGIFVQWQYEKLGRSYSDSFKWRREQGFAKMLQITRESYDLSGLNIANAKCGYWDNGAAIAICVKDLSKVNDYLATRNSSMVDAIKHRLATYDRVIINTGFLHMPSGDFMLHQSLYKAKSLSFPSKRKDFYPFIAKEKAKIARSVKLDEGAGSTQVIYDYLKSEKIPYRERIHGKML